MALTTGCPEDPRRHLRVAIIGSGFAGLGMAVHLKAYGEERFVVFEKEDGLGGTWWVNRYPGCACDVESHLYSFSFELNPDWSRRYATRSEIRAYLEACADKYGIHPHLRLSTAVRTLRWDEQRQHWQLEDSDGVRWSADIVVAGMGALSRPAYPKIPGIEHFPGPAFHSQHWDHDVGLAGKRVAVIGTGASAVQFVPQIQPRVERLIVYQRTPPWIMPKPDRRIRPWQQRMYRRMPLVQRAARALIYLRLEGRVVPFAFHPGLMVLPERLARAHLRRQVPDPDLRRRLMPDYRFGCKRVLISNDYYPALMQPNVELVTTGIREVRARSVIDADGRKRDADVLIFATGFHAPDPVPPGMIHGRHGRDLAEQWRRGPAAYKGTTVAGFPNLFLLLGPNTGLGHSSVVYMIESQIRYVMDTLRRMDQERIASVDVRPEVMAQYNEYVQGRLSEAVWNTGGCRSWYLHPVSGRNVTIWPDFTWRFRWRTRRFDPAAYRCVPTGGARHDAPALSASARVPGPPR